MAELPADVTVKAEEAPPAAPASYDGPGPLNEPPPETVAQAAPPPPPADETAQQTPVEMTPEQAAAAYAAQPDVQAAYAAAAAAYAAQPPQHYPQQQEVNRRLGSGRARRRPTPRRSRNCLRPAGCRTAPKGRRCGRCSRICSIVLPRGVQKIQWRAAIGKCSYKRSSADLDEEEAELKPLEQAFHLKMSVSAF